MSSAKSLTRIYFSGSLGRRPECVLPAAPSHHVARVLRLREGDAVTLFDGAGAECAARITRIGKHHVTLALGERTQVDRESPLAVTLTQAVSTGERMDYTVQKAVELGVTAVQPVTSVRAVARLDAARAAKRVAHWQAVAVAACEQCGRNRVPPVWPVLDLRRWLALAPLRPGALGLMLAPGAGRSLREIGKPAGEVTLLVGPEGGFAAEEERSAAAAGFVAVRLGPRVLRTETAAVAALAVLQARWGDF